MIQTFGKRILAMVVASAVVAGVTMTYGIPNIKYREPKSSEPVVMTVNGSPVHRDEFRAYLKYNKLYMEDMLGYYGYDDSIWSEEQMGETMVGQLFKMAEREAVYSRVVNQEFQNLHLNLTRQQREEAAQHKLDQVAQIGGQEMFDMWLSQMDYTMPLYDNTLAASAYVQAIYDAYYGENGTKATEQAILDRFKETYLCAKHILVQSVDGSGDPLTGDALSQARERANEALEKAKAGEDFDALIAQYNEDPGMEMYPDGYVFTEGDMVDEFYQGAKSLEPGQISQELVESPFGWHIIQREPLTQDQLTENIKTMLIMGITGKTFDQEIDALIEAADIQYEDTAFETPTYAFMQDFLGERDGEQGATEQNTEEQDAAPQPNDAQ